MLKRAMPRRYVVACSLVAVKVGSKRPMTGNRDALDELGWSEQMGLEQRIGLWVAIVTAVLTVLTFATWGLVAWLG